MKVSAALLPAFPLAFAISTRPAVSRPVVALSVSSGTSQAPSKYSSALLVVLYRICPLSAVLGLSPVVPLGIRN
ncbi:MAG: hypothetical protein ACR2K1_02775, partial [Saprospiraceae bacterium]